MKRTSPDEAVVVMGDFNTDACELEVLTGRLRRVATGALLEVDTGLQLEEAFPAVAEGACGSFGRTLRWNAGEGSSLRLVEAFEPVHGWGARVGPRSEGGHCTSINADRVEWIDYIWYSEGSLRPLGLSETLSPAEPIPDRSHGSDHMPVAALLEFLPPQEEKGQPGHGASG